MAENRKESGTIKIGKADIYYEQSGSGTPLVMIHAGVADSRMWNAEFAYFSQNYHVLRYDKRGYGKTDPVVGEFSHMGDFVSLLDELNINAPLILMGCSMGGGLAMDFAMKYPSRVKALIMVGSAPSGLELDSEEPAKFLEAVKAYEDGDLDLVAEIETQIWFDGMGRTPEQVDKSMRNLVFEMDRTVLDHEAKQLGQRQPDSPVPAFDRLNELNIPVLIIVGSHDIPYMHDAADYMSERIQSNRKIIIEDAAHMSNMDHPEEFREIVNNFLEEYIV